MTREQLSVYDYAKQYMPGFRSQCRTDLVSIAGGLVSGKEVNDLINKIAERIGQHRNQVETFRREDDEFRDVQKFVGKTGTVIVSAVRHSGSYAIGPFETGKDNYHTLKTLEILLRENTALCCATVKPGDTRKNIFGEWGVIIGGGEIKEAFPFIADTSFGSDGTVSSRYLTPDRHVMRQTDKVQSAFGSRRQDQCNEFDVKLGRGDIAGLYIYVGNDRDPTIDRATMKEIKTIMKLTGMPLYVLHNGKFMRISDVRNIRHPKSWGEPIAPEKIIKKTSDLKAHKYERAIKYLSRHLVLTEKSPVSAGHFSGQNAYQLVLQRPAGYIENYIEQQRIILQSETHPGRRLRVAMALYSFAKEAETANDLSISRKAMEVAVQVFSYEKYQYYLSRLKDSKFLLEKEDIQYYLTHASPPPEFCDI